MKTNILGAAALAMVLAAPALAGGETAHVPATADATVTADAAASVTTPAAPVKAEADITSGAGASVEAVKPTISTVSRGADGLPDVVSIDGQTYKVCKGEVQDSCINPRSAGLKFGARDLQYWPGRPASEISTPLPAEEPATLPAI